MWRRIEVRKGCLERKEDMKERREGVGLWRRVVIKERRWLGEVMFGKEEEDAMDWKDCQKGEIGWVVSFNI